MLLSACGTSAPKYQLAPSGDSAAWVLNTETGAVGLYRIHAMTDTAANVRMRYYPAPPPGTVATSREYGAEIADDSIGEAIVARTKHRTDSLANRR